MVKKFLSILMSISILFIFAGSNNAQSQYIDDRANLFSESAKTEANNKLSKLFQAHNIPVYLFTTDEDMGDNVRENADSQLRDRVGADKDGILLFINNRTDSKYIYITASGNKAMRIMTDQNQKELLKSVKPYLSDKKFDQALSKYVGVVSDFVEKGPVAGNVIVPEKSISILDIIGAGGGGLLAFLLAKFGIKYSATPKPSNNVYSLRTNLVQSVDISKDYFITTTTTSRLIPKSSSGSGSSSTTTTHKSSGGGTFTGSGDKF
ncbi:MAG: TPM domain-containing protein [Tissierellia bacterium]|nr:TPM domain-containing protein [Tissierellia bacterium]